MDIGFEQLLAVHNQEFKESEVFNNWMPPDGEYIVSLIKLDTGTFAQDGVSLPWWRLTGRIEDVQDAALQGKEFSVGFYTSKAFGILKGAVQALSGEQIDGLAEAHIILAESVGKVIRAKIETTKSAKTGKKYTNCYIQEVIDTTTSADSGSVEDVSNTTHPAPIETEPIPIETEAIPAPIETGEPPAEVLRVDPGNSSPNEVVAVDPPTAPPNRVG